MPYAELKVQNTVLRFGDVDGLWGRCRLFGVEVPSRSFADPAATAGGTETALET